MKPGWILFLSPVLLLPTLSACDGDDDSGTSSADGTTSAADGTAESTTAGTDSTTTATDATTGTTDETTGTDTGGAGHAGSCDGLDGGLQCWHAVGEFDTPAAIMEACTNSGGTYSAGDCPSAGLVAICDQTPFKIFHYYEGVDLALTEIVCGQIGGIWMPQP